MTMIKIGKRKKEIFTGAVKLRGEVASSCTGSRLSPGTRSGGGVGRLDNVEM